VLFNLPLSTSNRIQIWESGLISGSTAVTSFDVDRLRTINTCGDDDKNEIPIVIPILDRSR
jgi:hypothetical protein